MTDGESTKILLKRVEDLEKRYRALLEDRSGPVAVIGMAARFPGGGDGIDDFWDLLISGRSGITEIPPDRWDINRFYNSDPDAPGTMSTRYGGFIQGVDLFDNGFFGIAKEEAVWMDPQHRLVLQLAHHALEDAGERHDLLSREKVGVFTGVMTGDYGADQRALGAESQVTPFEVVGNEASFLAGRLSYWLKSHGPSMTLCTACSSSLVALHHAVQSLRAGESSMAVVAAANIILSPYWHVASSKMHALAPDGQCKTFDRRADGYVRGEGAGVLVLRRLSDAQRKRSPIKAVVRGSATNHGGGSSGLTAPNPKAQSAVIRDALRDAGANPSELVYLECHGTGTRLGDAVEIEAINDVFSKDRQAPLVVGAVKTNVGHLEAASGMVGIIKTIQCLRTGQVPPNRNFSEPSPDIDWRDEVVRLPLAMTNMPPGLAGVSSFGLSGINAHVILERAPIVEADDPTSLYADQLCGRVVCLSAPTTEGVDAVRGGLRDRLSASRSWSLPGVAVASQHRRTPFRARVAIIASSEDDLLTRLASDLAPVSAPARKVRFLLPGYGDQRAGMAATLLDGSPNFREAFDRVLSFFDAPLAEELRAFSLLDGGVEAADTFKALRRGQASGRSVAFSQPGLAHPFVFAMQMAYAHALRNLGVTPTAMFGYSLGEVTAACLAGVIPLDQAAHFVTERAEIIERAPEGRMIGVALDEVSLKPHLNADLYIAAQMGPQSIIVSGLPGAVNDLMSILDDLSVPTQPIASTRPMHCALMADCADALSKLASALALSAPQIPYLSNVTGTWITADQAQDPKYYGWHICSPVRASEGMQLIGRSSDALLEVGPGTSLSSQIRSVSKSTAPLFGPVFTIGRHRFDDQSEIEVMTATLAQMWMHGVDLAWPDGAGASTDTAALPLYPFAPVRHWKPDAASAFVKVPAKVADAQSSDRHGETPILVPGWRRCVTGGWSQRSDAHLIIVDDKWQEWTEQQRRKLAAYPGELNVVRVGRGWTEVLAACERAGKSVAHDARATVLFLPAPGTERGLDSTFHEPKAFLNELFDRPLVEHLDIQFMTRGAVSVTGSDLVDPLAAALHGLVVSARLEERRASLRVIDLDPGVPFDDALFLAASAPASSPFLAQRGTFLWEPDLQLLRPRAVKHVFEESGVYLLLGGCGAVGQALAPALAARGVGTLVLASRSASVDHPIIQALRDRGVAVVPRQVDVTDETAVAVLLDEVRGEFGRLDGVLHMAAVPGGGMLQVRGRGENEVVLATKIGPIRPLLNAAKAGDIGFVIFFSSVVANTGMVGETDYAAANAVLDAYATQSGGRVRSIGWGLWQHDAWQQQTFAAIPGIAKSIDDIRDRWGIGADVGIATIEASLSTSSHTMLASPVHPETLRDAMLDILYCRETQASERRVRPDLMNPFMVPGTEVEKAVASIWAAHLGLEKVGLDDNFFDLGGQSLLALRINKSISEQMEVHVPTPLLFGAPTVRSLARTIELLSAGDNVPYLPAPSSGRGLARREAVASHSRRRDGAKQ